MLNSEVYEKFCLKKDPFMGDIQGDKDVFLTQETQLFPFYMGQTFQHGGMVALVGESGSGKSTMRRLALSRLKAEGYKVKIIMPKIIDKGRLTASAICYSIVKDLGSQEAPKRRLEAVARQCERLLKDSHRAGYKHVLVIEEAHDLNLHTLKYLKRFWEMEDGYDKLLAILLIGQPELHRLLDLSSNWEAREVIQRIEELELKALGNSAELGAYLEHKFKRCGVGLEDVLAEGACEAIFARLSTKNGEHKLISGAFPLRVNNLLKEALNLAAEMQEKKIHADLIRSL